MQYIAYEGTQGIRTQVTLPDGTPVILNGATTLLVPKDFTHERTVLLDGEAYFNTALPLTVVSNIITISTEPAASFRMHCFESQQGATAYIGSGKVKVTKSYHSTTDNQPEFLERGNMILANNKIDLMEKETFQPDELDTWLQDKLVFNNVPFMNAMHKLEEWYSTEFYVEGDVSNAPALNGTFHHASLEQVLNTFQNNVKFTWQLKRDRVKVQF